MKKDFRLDEDLVLKGYWWIPNYENIKIYGDLLYKINKPIKLNLLGSFILSTKKDKKFEINISPAEGYEYREIVLGIGNGIKITLYKCFEI